MPTRRSGRRAIPTLSSSDFRELTTCCQPPVNSGVIQASIENGPDFGLPPEVIAGHQETLEGGIESARMIQSAGGVEKYEVTNIRIVPKEDASVLAPTEQKTLTLVTCYPFDALRVGGPLRYVVRARPLADAERHHPAIAKVSETFRL